MALASLTPVTPPAKSRWRISLRAFLSLFLLALSVLTVGGTGLIAYRYSYNLLTNSKNHDFIVNNRAAAAEIDRLLDDPAKRIFDEYIHRARVGLLPLQDTRALGMELAERLRARPQLAWISYSDAKTGDFTGAWRDNHRNVVLNRSSPGVNGGVGSNELVGEDGRLTPYVDNDRTPFDPRKSEWYIRAATSDDTAWSVPYDFADGAYGITSSHSWRAPGSPTVGGVFTVDFYLKDLEQEIGDISYQQKEFVGVFQPDGKLLVAPQGYMREQFAGTLGSLVKANGPYDSDDSSNARIEYNRLVSFEQGGEKYMVALHFVKTDTGLRCVVASLAAAAKVYADSNGTMETIAVSGCILLLVAIAAGWGLARRISRPLGILSSDLQKVGDFDLSEGPLKKSVFREMQILIESSERMKSGLRSFLRYVPDDLVRQLLHSGRDATLGVESRRLTILFSDIESFTSYSERVPPAQLVEDLSGYFEILRCEIRQRSGTIDKFIGDGMLAFFNAPFDVPSHEQRACEAALSAIAALEPAGGGVGAHPFRTRIGLHTGEVLVGNVGTHERFAYTVLGDPVNAASRIESLNKTYGTSILASEDVRAKAGEGFEWRHLDLAAVAGRKGAIHLHELLGTKASAGLPIPADILCARDLYEQALEKYFAQDFAKARDLFTQAAALHPEDRAARMMIGRCDDLLANPPGESWDGVFIHKHK